MNKWILGQKELPRGGKMLFLKTKLLQDWIMKGINGHKEAYMAA